MENYQERNLRFVLKHYRKGALDTGKAIAGFNAHVSEKGAPEVETGRSPLRGTRPGNAGRPVWLSVVSTAAAVAVGAFMYFNTGSRRWTEFATADAVRTCVLPDNTVVTAAPNSSVRFRKGRTFSRNRQVEMTGKVFFQVAKDPGHPFEITSGAGYVKVLGTEFQVEEIADTEKNSNHDIIARTEVSVRSGKVFFSKTPESEGLVLTNNMSASLDGKGNIPILINLAPNPEVWATGVFEYDAVPLRKVLDELSGYYGVPLSIVGEADQYGRRLTGSFDAEDLDEIIGIIEDTMDITIYETIR